MVKVPSLNGGRNARGSSEAPAAADDDRDADGHREQHAAMREARNRKRRAVVPLEHAHQRALALAEPLAGRAACSRPSPASA